MALKARSAVEQLTWHYEHPFAQAAAKARAGTPVAGLTSNTVPWELLRAAGYFPLLLNPAVSSAMPFAERLMEDGVFGSRIRGILDGIASRAWPFLKLVVIPRTSEQEHKLFLYLHEMARQGLATGLPGLYLYNLLHTRSEEAEIYGLERTYELRKYLEHSAARSIDETDIAAAVAESNRASQAIRRLLDFRGGPAHQNGEPCLSGTEALALIGAMYFMDRDEYAQLALEAAAEISRRTPLRGPRLLIKGSPLHHTGLHRAIESHRAIVCAEDDWWGSRALAGEIHPQSDMLRGIFETYYRHAPGPRELSNDWFSSAASTVDGVIFYLPPEDDVLGWDYPHLRAMLDERGTPHLLIREDASAELSEECHQSIDDFVRKLGA